jgi:hypothetical protein
MGRDAVRCRRTDPRVAEPLGPPVAPRILRGHPSRVKGASRRCAPLDPRASATPPGRSAGRPRPARRGARRHRRRPDPHDHGFDAKTGESDTKTRRNADHSAGTPDDRRSSAHTVVRHAVSAPNRRSWRPAGALIPAAQAMISDLERNPTPRVGKRTDLLIKPAGPPPGGAARPHGQARPARAASPRGRRGSQIKGRAAIAKRRRRRP